MRYPPNKVAPIAASLFYLTGATKVDVEFDFDQRGSQIWDIVFDTDGGTLKLSNGASAMFVDGAPVKVGGRNEYALLYARFAACLRDRRSVAGFVPFEMVAGAFAKGTCRSIQPFSWE